MVQNIFYLPFFEVHFSSSPTNKDKKITRIEQKNMSINHKSC